MQYIETNYYYYPKYQKKTVRHKGPNNLKTIIGLNVRTGTHKMKTNTKIRNHHIKSFYMFISLCVCVCVYHNNDFDR